MPFHRSTRTPSGGGLFLMMDGAKRQTLAAGQSVVDLSVGASDLPGPPEALQALQEAIQDPGTHSYCLRSGTVPLLEAAVRWYEGRYGLQLDPSTEALMLIGSQEGLAHALLAAADHGDAIIMTDVAYPSYFGAVQIAGLVPIYMPLGPDWLPRFEDLDVQELKQKKARVLLLNYPNNPTSATADEAFFARAIAFCKAHDLLLIHDAPYVDQTYDTDHAVSPLSLPGGRDCCLELFSFSKSFHIAGFRLGFALGNRDAISALERIKAPIDFNQYIGIQRMGITCLGLPRERLRQDAATWQRRAAAMCEALQQHAGWEVKVPSSCMYLWVKLPPGLGDDLSFCLQLVERSGVALSPGRAFGSGGTGFVRFALVQPEEQLREAAARIGRFVRERAAELSAAPATADDTPLIASLRGRHLAGFKYQLPSSYVGLALAQSEQPPSSQQQGKQKQKQQQQQQQQAEEECDDDMEDAAASGDRGGDGGGDGGGAEAAPPRHWQALSTFESVTLWGHDTMPAKGNQARRCLDWLELARKVHAPVTREQVLQQLSLMKK